MSTIRKYGYIKSKVDDRDLLVRFTNHHVLAFAMLRKLEAKPVPIFDLRNIVTLPQALSDIDQGRLGSCTANAIAYAYAFDEIKQSNKEVFLPSRLFIYYNERMMEGTVMEDSGAQIRDGIKSINKYGVCDEHHWIYDPLQFTVKPPAEVYTEAKLARAVRYAKIDFSQDKTTDDRVNHIKRALMSGFPFVFGFTVYESFESEEVAKTGMVPMPKEGEKILGGHAVCGVGFDDTKQCFIIKNSWGPKWGLNGYFYMPYNYVADTNLADDFWVIQQVTNPDNIPNFSPEDINPDAKNLNVDVNGESSYCIII
ncbi:cathepsin B, cystein protease [Tupanvirus soda lake]|uniref:Cathepsin B, cystein protease n=2 Tax=Tupanvirus TaxID=2094720 RepID=A0A6N1NVH2_9VIRU|nr:cathepsin B, cystein protease [Tupanvirus soda lake]QKU35446.1 cathepsin B, cystein protease [Tupanvirus soda lake]